MNDAFDVLNKQAAAIHELVTDTCTLCGGSYIDNLDGAITYFMLDGVRFRLTVNKI
jgi:hypothetical protein